MPEPMYVAQLTYIGEGMWPRHSRWLVTSNTLEEMQSYANYPALEWAVDIWCIERPERDNPVTMEFTENHTDSYRMPGVTTGRVAEVRQGVWRELLSSEVRPSNPI